MKSRGDALRDYVIRRLLLMVPTFLGITLVTFTLLQFVPGGQIDQIRMQLAGAGGAGELAGGGGGGAIAQLEIPEEQLAQLTEYYGFDRPLPVAYVSWLWDVLRLDFGQSFRYTEPVLRVIGERLPVSIYYGLITAFFTYGICIPLGILKAIKHRTNVDNLTSVLIFLGYAIPGFALGAVLSNLLAVRFEIFPLGGFQSEGAADLSFLAQVWRHRVALDPPADCVPCGRVCDHHDAHEEQPHREHECRLRQDGAGEGPELAPHRVRSRIEELADPDGYQRGDAPRESS